MFELTKVHKTGARCGKLITAHGGVKTPFFMPIATKGAVKTLAVDELESIEQAVDKETGPVVLSNTYHLYLKPGLDVLKQAGGLHKFMQWPHTILTDSGGFQVFSLAHLRKLTDDGVEFSSHLDGSKHFFSPEQSMEIQSVIAADIWMAFDYFPGYPATEQQAQKSVELTTAWAKRCKKWFDDQEGSVDNQHQLFGIVQGSTFPELRKKSAAELIDLDFDGYAVGGLAVGEPPEVMLEVLDYAVPELPDDKPRYLMGVGPPEQILEAVKRGIDMFDCVIPTRNARHGSAFVHEGGKERIVAANLEGVNYEKVNITAEKWKSVFEVLDSHCLCSTCQKGCSRAYIRHLFTVDEPLAARLVSVHNISFYMQLMSEIRQEIVS